MEMTKTDLYFSILRHEVRNLKEWGKKTGTVHEKDLQTLYFGMPMTEEFWNRERESFEIGGIRVISASEGGSIFFPEPEELKEAFREDEMTQKYLQELQKNDLAHRLVPELEEELAGRRDQAEEAEKRLVEGNLLRVISIARQYTGQGLPSLDLFYEGNQALVDAVRVWNPEKDCPITLYLIYHIRRGICASLAYMTDRPPQIPQDVMETVRKMREEAADMDAISRRQNSRLPVIGENPILSRLKLRVVEYPDLVSPREMEVIRLRLGLTDGTVHTVDQVAECFGITPERVAQIENRFLRRVRAARGRKMQQFFTETSDLHESPEFGKTDPGI